MKCTLLQRTVFFLLLLISTNQLVGQEINTHAKLQASLAKGWNTWSYGSMLTHVLLPEGLALKINFRHAAIGTPYDPDYFLEDITVDKTGRVRPIAHTFDGAYTELLITQWFGSTIRVQSASSNGEIAILVTPEFKSSTPFHIELQTGLMWNRKGTVARKGNSLTADIAAKQWTIQSTAKGIETYHGYTSPYLSFSGDSAVGIYTGAKKNLAQVKAIIQQAKEKYHSDAKKYGAKAEGFKATQSVLGWNTLYDPEQNRVITPVTRGWNEAWQGYVLFEWDTYFASLLFTLGNKELAYSNAIAITHGQDSGYVGFWQRPGVEASQSQPPVGSLACWLIYEKYREKWFLQEVYPELLKWNRWWMQNRLNKVYLTWGAPWKGAEARDAKLESGLDNSPMYDDITMMEVGKNTLMNLGDVGLNSLYVADCKYLANIAKALGKTADEKELLTRAKLFTDKVQELWVAEKGIFLNKYLDKDVFSERLSPTLFYPMIAGIATPEQAKRMLQEHYFNPKEFYGTYILPSIAYNDSSYDNNYWRGSIWGPMNFLVYLGLRNYDQRAATELANRSYDLFEKAWSDHHYIFENINSDKGILKAEDQLNCDPYYHWGALMGLMKFIDEEKSTKK
jgi:putative isomerase